MNTFTRRAPSPSSRCPPATVASASCRCSAPPSPPAPAPTTFPLLPPHPQHLHPPRATPILPMSPRNRGIGILPMFRPTLPPRPSLQHLRLFRLHLDIRRPMHNQHPALQLPNLHPRIIFQPRYH